MKIIYLILWIAIGFILVRQILKIIFIKPLLLTDLEFLLKASEEERIAYLEKRKFRAVSDEILNVNPYVYLKFYRGFFNGDTVKFQHKKTTIENYNNRLSPASIYLPIEEYKPYIEYSVAKDRHRFFNKLRILLKFMLKPNSPIIENSFADDYIDYIKKGGLKSIEKPDFIKEGFEWLDITETKLTDGDGYFYHTHDKANYTLYKKDNKGIVVQDIFKYQGPSYMSFYYYHS